MHTKLKGDIGELIVAAELMSRGWNVAFPYGENVRYDLIAEKKGVLKRIQVKSVMPRNGALRINCRSSNNWSVINYSSADFEILAAVDLESRNVYFIPSRQIRRSQINLRLTEAKNKQKKSVNEASAFMNI